MIELDNFFEEKYFNFLRQNCLDSRKNTQRLTTEKDANTGLELPDLLVNSQYSSLFNTRQFKNVRVKLIKRLYDLSEGDRERELWHFDHSKFTLIIPVNLSGETFTKFSPYVRFSGRQSIIDNIFARLFKFRYANISLKENCGLLFEGNKYYHSSEQLKGPLTRHIIVLHFD